MKKTNSRNKSNIPAPFMPPMKKSQVVAKEVEDMLRKHIMDLGEFLESLGFTETNQSEFVIKTEK